MRAQSVFRLSLVAAALSPPAPALALGLGKLTVNAGLGQPLSAQVELTAATRDELESLSARVADASLYRQNNLAFQGVLSRSRVTVEQGPGGAAFLKVTTVGNVAEPYLDLLIEVNWAAGRVVRAYTFLLDPPGATAAPPVDPVTPPRTVPPGSYRLKLPESQFAGEGTPGPPGPGSGERTGVRPNH